VHGYGARCHNWEGPKQTPWCYVARNCSSPGVRRGSFGEGHIECEWYDGSLAAGSATAAADGLGSDLIAVDAPTAAAFGAAGSALRSNGAASFTSTYDLHATLLQLPMLPLISRLPNATLPATCGVGRAAAAAASVSAGGAAAPGRLRVRAIGGCSLLHPLPRDRTCADALGAPSLCALIAPSAPATEHEEEGREAEDGEAAVATPFRTAPGSALVASVPAAMQGTPWDSVSAAAATAQLKCHLRRVRTRAAEGVVAAAGGSEGGSGGVGTAWSVAAAQCSAPPLGTQPTICLSPPPPR
jgi:hypothetical protein